MSSFLFGIGLALFAAVWLSLAIRGIVRDIKDSRAKWIMGLMGFLVAVGAGGFFAAGLASMDVFKIPSSFQWPAGYVSGVVRTPDGRSSFHWCLWDESSFTIRSGISYVAGMLMQAAVILGSNVHRTERSRFVPLDDSVTTLSRKAAT